MHVYTHVYIIFLDKKIVRLSDYNFLKHFYIFHVCYHIFVKFGKKSFCLKKYNLTDFFIKKLN